MLHSDSCVYLIEPSLACAARGRAELCRVSVVRGLYRIQANTGLGRLVTIDFEQLNAWGAGWAATLCGSRD